MSCRRCGLWDVNSNCMHGDGDTQPYALFVGEAPGKTEDEQGRPFVGSSGQLLKDLLEDANEENLPVRFTNVNRCRPPNNDTPDAKQIKACLPFLLAEIKRTNPKVIVPLGNTAMKALCGFAGIEKHRGRKIIRDGRVYLPTFHPAKVLRDSNFKDAFVEDLITVFSPELTAKADMKYEEVSAKEAYEILKDVEEFSFDIEATTKDPWLPEAQITCISFSCEDYVGLVVYPCSSSVASVYLSDWYWIEKILQLKAKKILQYGKYDAKYIKVVQGIDVKNWDWDTLLMFYVHNVYPPHNLEYLGDRYVPECSGHKDAMRIALKKMRVRKTKILEQEVLGIADLPKEDLTPYNATDSIVTLLLKKKGVKLLKEQGTLDYYQKVIQPATKHLLEVELTGMKIDLKYAELLGQRMDSAIRLQEHELYKHTYVKRFLNARGVKEINFNSSQQIAELLYKHAGLKAVAKTKKTGNPSTAEDHLIALHHPLADAIIERRKVANLNSKYGVLVDKHGNRRLAVQNWIKPDDLAHTNFDIDTTTGRLSSEDPNLQQIPRKSTAGDYGIKQLFISRFKNGSIISADYSQIELRVFAVLANCEKMLKVFREGGDIHHAVAKEIFRTDNIDEAKRADAKRVNFGILYGESERGLQRVHGNTIEYWKKFLRDYKRLYPEIAMYMKDIQKQLLEYECVRSPFGHVRGFPGYSTMDDEYILSEMERAAGNTPIQNSASMICLTSGMRLSEVLKKKKMRTCVIVYVHDQVLLDSPKEERNDAIGLAKEILESPQLDWLGDMPIPVDISVGSSWGTAETIKI